MARFFRAGKGEGGSGVNVSCTFTIAIEARTKDGKTKYSIGNHPSSRVMQMLGGFDYDEETEESRQTDREALPDLLGRTLR